MKAILYAFLAAVFYAINIPASKILLRDVGPTTMAALLYLGAGIGIAGLSLFNAKDRRASAPLSRKDLPYVIGMIVLDIAAPIFLMFGIRHGSSANASLLGNFEIVATALVALFVFREAVSKRLWAAIALITLASALLSFEDANSFKLSAHCLSFWRRSAGDWRIIARAVSRRRAHTRSSSSKAYSPDWVRLPLRVQSTNRCLASRTSPPRSFLVS